MTQRRDERHDGSRRQAAGVDRVRAKGGPDELPGEHGVVAQRERAQAARTSLVVRVRVDKAVDGPRAVNGHGNAPFRPIRPNRASQTPSWPPCYRELQGGTTKNLRPHQGTIRTVTRSRILGQQQFGRDLVLRAESPASRRHGESWTRTVGTPRQLQRLHSRGTTLVSRLTNAFT